MIVVCGTETSATTLIPEGPNAVPLPSLAECGWGWCNVHVHRILILYFS